MPKSKTMGRNLGTERGAVGPVGPGAIGWSGGWMVGRWVDGGGVTAAAGLLGQRAPLLGHESGGAAACAWLVLEAPT